MEIIVLILIPVVVWKLWLRKPVRAFLRYYRLSLLASRGVFIPRQYRGMLMDDYFTQLSKLPEFADQRYRAQKILWTFYDDFLVEFDDVVQQLAADEGNPLQSTLELLESLLREAKPIVCATILARLNAPDAEIALTPAIQDALRHLSWRGRHRRNYEVPGLLAELLLRKYTALKPNEEQSLSQRLSSKETTESTLRLWLELGEQAKNAHSSFSVRATQ